MSEDEVIALLKCLADRSRLQIVRSLAGEDLYVELLAERLGLAASTVSFHLKKLAAAGVVSSYRTQYYVMYSLNRDVLDRNLLELVSARSDEAEEQRRREVAYRQRVIDSFFEYGRLTAIPKQRKKERIVLEVIAESFESGRVYAEREVNDIISSFHDDFCTIRRDMVGEGLLARSEKGYWRPEG